MILSGGQCDRVSDAGYAARSGATDEAIAELAQ
jgi:hypothetical protein